MACVMIELFFEILHCSYYDIELLQFCIDAAQFVTKKQTQGIQCYGTYLTGTDQKD